MDRLTITEDTLPKQQIFFYESLTKQYRWVPKLDITPYELAMLTLVMFSRNFNKSMQEVVLCCGERVWRHFEEVK